MNICSCVRCNIGEAPIWNEEENLLYFTNGYGGNEICKLNLNDNTVIKQKVLIGVSAFAFNKQNKLIVSRQDGVFYLNKNNNVEQIYDTCKFSLKYCNDMKVGPDGRIYVGTQSSKRKGVSDKIDGKLYSIDKNGEVKILLDGLLLSNGLDWSMNEKRFYHTDSDTGLIKEYDFDKKTGNIEFTGRQVEVSGVDGFTIDQNDNLLVACWGRGHIAVVDTKTFSISSYIRTPFSIPTSCGFCGKDMSKLAITSATLGADLKTDVNAGFTAVLDNIGKGRKPYLYG